MRYTCCLFQHFEMAVLDFQYLVRLLDAIDQPVGNGNKFADAIGGRRTTELALDRRQQRRVGYDCLDDRGGDSFVCPRAWRTRPAARRKARRASRRGRSCRLDAFDLRLHLENGAVRWLLPSP